MASAGNSGNHVIFSRTGEAASGGGRGLDKAGAAAIGSRSGLARRDGLKRRWKVSLALCAALVPAAAAAAPLAVVDRHGSYVAVEPYGPNIVRITLATEPALADSAPGYGVSGKADPGGWTH